MRFTENEDVSKFARGIIEFYHRFYIDVAGEAGCPLHDPLAMGICIDRDFVSKIQPCNLRVVQNSEQYLPTGRTASFSEELIRGQTIVEKRKGVIAKGIKPNVDVCLIAKSDEFLDFFADTIAESKYGQTYKK